ncbi:MAG: hypothetical protein LBJ00_16720 [Planctomycetaceae bacterium]|jgi:hypothetical protein|nr:hypothetical protein [Planctomycetaceae bacterium]
MIEIGNRDLSFFVFYDFFFLNIVCKICKFFVVVFGMNCETTFNRRGVAIEIECRTVRQIQENQLLESNELNFSN